MSNCIVKLSECMRTAMNREGTIHVHDSTVHIWEEDVTESMRTSLARVVVHLKNGGWSMRPDARVLADYPAISRDNWEGRSGDLEVKVSLCGRHLEIVFFQNLSVENRAGGFYDFRKLERMTAVSRRLRLQCLAEMYRVVRCCEAIGYVLTERDGFRNKSTGAATQLLVRDLAELGDNRGTPLESFNRGWGSDRFERDETGWPSAKEISSCWGQHDRDGKPITQGITKFRRGRDGRLARGQVFGGINGNWQLVSNDRTIAWSHSAREFFDCEHPEREPRRVHDQTARLRTELENALKAGNYARVCVLGACLARREPEVRCAG